jgi:hypothetical protein
VSANVASNDVLKTARLTSAVSPRAYFELPFLLSLRILEEWYDSMVNLVNADCGWLAMEGGAACPVAPQIFTPPESWRRERLNVKPSTPHHFLRHLGILDTPINDLMSRVITLTYS